MDGNTVKELNQGGTETIQVLVQCKNCGSSDVEAGYTLALCQKCRDQFVNRPIPLWIKGVFAFVVLISLYALTNFPTSLKAGVAYERGVRAEKAKKMLTAVREYQQVEVFYPNSTPLLERLSIGYYQTDHIEKFVGTLEKLVGRKVSSDYSVSLINSYTDAIAMFYMPTEEFASIMAQYENASFEEKQLPFEQYLKTHPDDYLAMFYLADVYYELKKFDLSEELLNDILLIYPHFPGAQLYMASICREKGNFSQALYYCNQVLEVNQENPDAYVALSKIQLKQYQDQSGLELAEKAYQLDRDNFNAIGNMALALHYNGRTAERDQMMEKLKSIDSNNEKTFTYYNEIFIGQREWREER